MSDYSAARNGARRRGGVLAVLTAVTLFASADAAAKAPQQISNDPFTNSTSQHQTAVEPDSFAFGKTVVAAFQLGRFFDGGASGIGYATSTDEGQTWTTGVLSGVTKLTTPAGAFDRASDPNVTYDAVHGRWLISILGINRGSSTSTAIILKRSPDGLDWSSPAITAAPANGKFAHDKNWAVCDNGPASPFRGHCYLSYSDETSKSTITTRTSLDGGANWSGPVTSPDATVHGVGTLPVVRPDGALVVPYLEDAHAIAEIRSADGGATFGGRIQISDVTLHQPIGMRAPALPSADVDAGGRVFVAWHDCRFRIGCPNAPDDIVYATSADGVSWSGPVRVPIDGPESTTEHFIPGLAVDPATQGAAARLGLAYYFYASTPCTSDSCRLEAGYVASADGGSTWSAPELLSAAPMPLAWIPNTDQGRMVGDYVSTSFTAGGTAVPVVSLAGAFDSSFHQAIFAALFPTGGTPGSGTTAQPPAAQAPSGSASVTLAASRRVVDYGQPVALHGAVSSRGGGESVEIVGRFRVKTRSDGTWLRTIRPGISSSFKARWKGIVSSRLSIAVRPRLDLTVRGGRLFLRALSVRSFAGRVALLQRRTARGWSPIRRIRLGGASAASFRPDVPAGSRIRVVLPRSQVGPGYLGGVSRVLVVKAF